MSTTPKKVSISRLHEDTGLDRVTIRKRLAGVPFTDGEKGAKMYERSVVLPLLLGNKAPQREDEAKTRRAIAEAERAELRVKQIKSELVSADKMRGAAGELVKSLYQRIVRVEPGIIAGKCIGKTAIEIETTIRESLAVVFNELKTMPENFLAIEDDEITDEFEDDEDGD